MTRILAVLIGLFVCYGQTLAATPADVEAKLKADMVTAKNEKFTIDRIRICQLFRPKELGGGASEPFQVKSHAEARSMSSAAIILSPCWPRLGLTCA